MTFISGGNKILSIYAVFHLDSLWPSSIHIGWFHLDNIITGVILLLWRYTPLFSSGFYGLFRQIKIQKEAWLARRRRRRSQFWKQQSRAISGVAVKHETNMSAKCHESNFASCEMCALAVMELNNLLFTASRVIMSGWQIVQTIPPAKPEMSVCVFPQGWVIWMSGIILQTRNTENDSANKYTSFYLCVLFLPHKALGEA